MLKRIFWAGTITFPLYLFILLEQSPPSFKEIVQWTEQPKQVISHLKQKITQFGQEIPKQKPASMKSQRSF